MRKEGKIVRKYNDLHFGYVDKGNGDNNRGRGERCSRFSDAILVKELRKLKIGEVSLQNGASSISTRVFALAVLGRANARGS